MTARTVQQLFDLTGRRALVTGQVPRARAANGARTRGPLWQTWHLDTTCSAGWLRSPPLPWRGTSTAVYGWQS